LTVNIPQLFRFALIHILKVHSTADEPCGAAEDVEKLIPLQTSARINQVPGQPVAGLTE
jgi:hypothetical protein